jgi:hypothetical protein
MQRNDGETPESRRDGSVIETLARETGSEPAYVRELYEREVAHLEANAKIRGYVSLLASRNVRIVLRESSAKSG